MKCNECGKVIDDPEGFWLNEKNLIECTSCKEAKKVGYCKELENKYIKKFDENCFTKDHEANGCKADDIIMRFLKEIGFKKLSEKFDEISRYY